MALKALLLIFVSVDTVNAAGTSCVYNTPLKPKCAATCGACGLSTCKEMEIYGAVSSTDYPDANMWANAKDAVDFAAFVAGNQGYLKKGGGSQGLCYLNGTVAGYPLVGGHRHFFEYKVAMQKECIANPGEKFATLASWTYVDELGHEHATQTNMKHPCNVFCSLHSHNEDGVAHVDNNGIPKDKFQCELRTTAQAVGYHAKADYGMVAKKRAAITAEGGLGENGPCVMKDSVAVIMASEMFGMDAQMEMYNMDYMYASRTEGIAGFMVDNPDGSPGLDEAAATVMWNLFTNPSNMMTLMKKGMRAVQHACMHNPTTKYINLVDSSVMTTAAYFTPSADAPFAYATDGNPSVEMMQWMSLADSMFGQQIIKEDVKGKTALFNNCECNMKFFNTNTEMKELYVSMTKMMAAGFTDAGEPNKPMFVPMYCYKDQDGVAYSRQDLADKEVPLAKLMKFDANGYHRGCEHWTCKNGEKVDSYIEPVSIYTKVASESLTTARATGDIKSNADAATYMDSIYGESAAQFELNRRLPNQAVGEMACPTLKDTFHTNGCTTNQCPGSHSPSDGSTVYDHTHERKRKRK